MTEVRYSDERYSRTLNLIGRERFEKLRDARVLVIGVGGVGSYASEAVIRSGIGHVDLMDGDAVAPSNLNRQLVALTSTLGMNKAEVMAARAHDIDPDTVVSAIPRFYREDDDLDLTSYDWVIDAIDDVNAKTALIIRAVTGGVNIVSAMGAAGKTGTHFKAADLAETKVCPLARVMRKRLRAAGIEHVPVVYSEEMPAPRNGDLGTLSYVPGAAGLTIAGYVIQQIADSK